MRKTIVMIFAVIAALGMLAVATGCSGGYAYRSEPVRKGPPPPWAPAHGARAKHHYRYYPGAQVYYDSDRRIYFYLSGSTWITGSRLPATISISGSYVILDMDDDMPYRHHEEVRKHHPSGHKKEQKGEYEKKKEKEKVETKRKGKDKDKDDDDHEREKGKGKGKDKKRR